jgi:acyl-CoA synthetase (AMP-forming)/AMP-acid ligase II/acyl carrier protein
MNVNACIPNAIVYGLGGATEASIWSNWHEVTDIDKDRASIPYGIPLANQKMFILNDNMEIVPNNVPGDLYIAGAGLARCYWNDTERTRAAFIENAFDGLRLYNTGDLAMYSPEGHIVFLGREDGQIKLGGYRIEIGEIESAIRKLTNCNNAVVFSGNQLTAYVSRNDNDINVLEGLKDLIPSYMIPKAVYDIDDMPLSANGKVDRKKLIKMFDNTGNVAKCELPRSEVEINLAGIWQECLGIEQIYLGDNFFLKGGDSLKAVTIVNEIKNSFHVELNLGTIFEHPTIEALAGVIEEQICDAEEGEI